MLGHRYQWDGVDRTTKEGKVQERSITSLDVEVAHGVFERFARLLATENGCLRGNSTRVAEIVAKDIHPGADEREYARAVGSVKSSLSYLRRALGGDGWSIRVGEHSVTLGCKEAGDGFTRFDIAVNGKGLEIDTRNSAISVWQMFVRDVKALETARITRRAEGADGESVSVEEATINALAVLRISLDGDKEGMYRLMEVEKRVRANQEKRRREVPARPGDRA